MAYHGFDAKGFRLTAVFDADSAKIGTRFGPFASTTSTPESADEPDAARTFLVQPLSELRETILRSNIRLAILAVPAEAAQAATDLVVAAGVRGILNFAPVSLTVPGDVAVTAVDLAVQLEQLSFQVNFTPISLPESA